MNNNNNSAIKEIDINSSIRFQVIPTATTSSYANSSSSISISNNTHHIPNNQSNRNNSNLNSKPLSSSSSTSISVVSSAINDINSRKFVKHNNGDNSTIVDHNPQSHSNSNNSNLNSKPSSSTSSASISVISSAINDSQKLVGLNNGDNSTMFDHNPNNHSNSNRQFTCNNSNLNSKLSSSTSSSLISAVSSGINDINSQKFVGHNNGDNSTIVDTSIVTTGNHIVNQTNINCIDASANSSNNNTENHSNTSNKDKISKNNNNHTNNIQNNNNNSSSSNHIKNQQIDNRQTNGLNHNNIVNHARTAVTAANLMVNAPIVTSTPSLVLSLSQVKLLFLFYLLHHQSNSLRWKRKSKTIYATYLK